MSNKTLLVQAVFTPQSRNIVDLRHQFFCVKISVFFVKISGMLKFKAFTILTALSHNVFATDLPPVCEVVLALSRQELFFLTWFSNCRLINFNVGMEFVSHSRTGETSIMELL